MSRSSLPAGRDCADRVEQRRRAELHAVHQVIAVEVGIKGEVGTITDVHDQPEQSADRAVIGDPGGSMRCRAGGVEQLLDTLPLGRGMESLAMKRLLPVGRREVGWGYGLPASGAWLGGPRQREVLGQREQWAHRAQTDPFLGAEGDL